MTTVKPKRKVVVHMGNVGHGGSSEMARKTREYATRFPDVHFYGIDMQPHLRTRRNWTQIQGTFEEGLHRIPDSTAHVISSEMGLGYYIAGNEAQQQRSLIPILRLAYRKLLPGGKLMIVASPEVTHSIRNALFDTGFKYGTVEVTSVSAPGHNRTYWMKKIGKDLMQLVAEKKSNKTNLTK